ncbi:SpoIIE family protein phosphatase [Actinomadura violacea]|uniref:SpoIIE family protein phosphatase n=1 Tax=Actinomadura violacea TaxID=2819934 RepID=A0ABS3RNA6_9ACTN|nr:SpoIIE family protein phosphatase [Actinomadura violacea]MBO2458242.1 SpoIIE family protein phosphatase [Actinomadura violacea]
MSDPDAHEGAQRTFPPSPISAAHARDFVRDRLAGSVALDTLRTAELLVSELVTNAVLHARTEVGVSVRSVDGTVHARVVDGEPRRGLVPRRRHPYTDTGRGLYLVERLASRCGADTGEKTKSVWFELGPSVSPSAASAGWGPAVPYSGDRRSVTLADLPWALCMAEQQHRHALLRELVLASSAGDPLGIRPDDLEAAHDVSNVISACVAAACEGHPADADVRTLTLPVPAHVTPALLALRRVLDKAEEATRFEALLTRPALPQLSALRRWMLDEIIGQFGGGAPTAWTVVPREPTDSSLELRPWNREQIQASRFPTIAIDDRNQIIAANEAASDLVGWDAGDLVGRRLPVLIPEHLRERHLAAFTSLLLTGRPRILGRPVPVPALHRDGRLIPIRLLIQAQEMSDGRTVFVAQLLPRTAAPEPPPADWPGELNESRAAALAEPPPASPRLYEPAQRARGRDRSMSELERLSLLAESRRAGSEAEDLPQALRQFALLLTRRLADWCAVDLIDEHDEVERAIVVHHDPGSSPSAYEGALPPPSSPARGPLARALRGAGPLLLTGTPPMGQGESPLDTRYAELSEQLGVGSAVVASLQAHREVLGALTVGRLGSQRPFMQDDVDLVGELARGLALQVANLRRFTRVRTIAQHLQHSLLPALPEIENLRLAARYVPSAITAQVGGDWYDGFALPDGGTAVVIGDVTGSDIDATATMSRLSSMLRGISVVCQEPPEEVLRHLDMANRTLAQEATGTCVYAVVKECHAGLWELSYSSAGHLPPLLTTQDGEARYLEDGGGLMLGTGFDLPRPGARVPLPADSTVLLYTDGLIERRGEPLDRGLDRLREQAAALSHAPLEVFCDELLIRLGSDSTDDTAFIALRPTSP